MLQPTERMEEPMKIVFISDWFVEKMGYADNCLPKALAKFGDEVHLVSSDLHPDFPNYKETYEAFIGPRQQACTRTGTSAGLRS